MPAITKKLSKQNTMPAITKKLSQKNTMMLLHHRKGKGEGKLLLTERLVACGSPKPNPNPNPNLKSKFQENLIKVRVRVSLNRSGNLNASLQSPGLALKNEPPAVAATCDVDLSPKKAALLKASKILRERQRQLARMALEKVEEKARLNAENNFDDFRELQRIMGPSCGGIYSLERFDNLRSWQGQSVTERFVFGEGCLHAVSSIHGEVRWKTDFVTESSQNGGPIILELQLDKIRRPLMRTKGNDPKKVQRLMDSIKEIGLQVPQLT